MRLEINSRKLGTIFTFSMPDEGGYVWVREGNGDARQLVHGGGLWGGPTVRAKPETFERKCRRWYHAYLMRQKKDAKTANILIRTTADLKRKAEERAREEHRSLNRHIEFLLERDSKRADEKK